MPSRRQTPPRRPVTQKDVAKAAGVTQNTVSVALRDRPGRMTISPETRDRIRALALELGYTPNLLARSLTLSRSETIGLYCRRPFGMDAPWSAMIFNGMQKACVRHGMDLLLHPMALNETNGGYGIARGKVDGMIVYTDTDDPMLPTLLGSGLPLVSLAITLPGIPGVVDDGESGMRQLARHLHGRGHRRVLYRDFSPAPSARCRAFQTEAVGLGMEVHPMAFDYSGTGEFTAAEDRLLDLDRVDRCTALVGSADSLVAPALAQCRRRGWRVPQDLAVAGFDGLRMIHQQPLVWQLTTLRVDWQKLAETAVDRLLDLVQGRKVPASTVMPVELVVGETT